MAQGWIWFVSAPSRLGAILGRSQGLLRCVDVESGLGSDVLCLLVRVGGQYDVLSHVRSFACPKGHAQAGRYEVEHTSLNYWERMGGCEDV